MHAYYRYALPLEYRAAHTGSVGPLAVQLRGSIFTSVKRGARGLEAEARETFAVSEPVTLNILPVPKTGQPDTFTGGVGTFKTAASAVPTKVHVGDPITLTVRVTGTGNLPEIGSPNLLAQEKWTESFKIYEDPSPGRMEDDAKVFTISVRPKSSQITELPSIKLSYFNPKLEKYQDTYTDSIPLQVEESPRFDSSSIVDMSGASRSSELTELLGGIVANYSGLDMLEPHEPYRLSLAGWFVVVLAPPGLWCMAYAWHRHVVRVRHDPARRRAQRAYSRAVERLKATTGGGTVDVPDEVAKAVAGYLADRLNLSAGELTPAEGLHFANMLGASPPLAGRFSELLVQCDQSRFARGGAAVSFESLVKDAHVVLQEMERNVARAGRVRDKVDGSGLRLVIGAALLLPFSGRVAAQPAFSRIESLNRANDLFEQAARTGDAETARQLFVSSIREYELLVADGVENGKLYYNLANAYFRAGDVPRAILYYRLAERLLPRDEQIGANLKFARSRVPDLVEATDTGRLLRQLLIAHYRLSVRERMQWSAISFAAAWAVLGLRIWLPRRWLTIAGLIGLTVSMSFIVSVYLQINEEAHHPIGVLVSDGVLVRKGDAETYEPQFNRPLGAGVEFRVLNRRGDWLHIEISDGKNGWIRVDQALVAGARSDKLLPPFSMASPALPHDLAK
jgi:tetratricopeptide (TPR) repeat protein